MLGFVFLLVGLFHYVDATDYDKFHQSSIKSFVVDPSTGEIRDSAKFYDWVHVEFSEFTKRTGKIKLNDLTNKTDTVKIDNISCRICRDSVVLGVEKAKAEEESGTALAFYEIFVQCKKTFAVLEAYFNEPLRTAESDICIRLMSQGDHLTGLLRNKGISQIYNIVTEKSVCAEMKVCSIDAWDETNKLSSSRMVRKAARKERKNKKKKK